MVNMVKVISSIIILFFLGNFSLNAQNKRVELQKKREAEAAARGFKGFIFPMKDSVFHVNLDEIEIIRHYPFKNKREEKKYSQLQLDVLKVYPLAMVVSSELKLVNAEIDSIYNDKSKKKAYLKWYQSYVYNTYIDTLKTLDIRQGRLLLKLIDRETGKTPYDLIKTYRGGFNAILWQSAAFMFGANLKSTFDPEDDAMIEHIIKRYKAGDFN